MLYKETWIWNCLAQQIELKYKMFNKETSLKSQINRSSDKLIKPPTGNPPKLSKFTSTTWTPKIFSFHFNSILLPPLAELWVWGMGVGVGWGGDGVGVFGNSWNSITWKKTTPFYFIWEIKAGSTQQKSSTINQIKTPHRIHQNSSLFTKIELKNPKNKWKQLENTHKNSYSFNLWRTYSIIFRLFLPAMAARTQLWAFLSMLEANQYMVCFPVCEEKTEKRKNRQKRLYKVKRNGNWQLAKTVVNWYHYVRVTTTRVFSIYFLKKKLFIILVSIFIPYGLYDEFDRQASRPIRVPCFID